MSKRILFLSKGEQDSSTRYRALQYFPYFKSVGWQPRHVTISGGVLAIFNALISAKKSDVVVLLRKSLPFPILWLLRKVSKKLVFDFDDAIFCNSDGSYSQTRMNRFIKTATMCDHIFAGNAYLAEEASKYNPKVTIIPTSVDSNKYALPRQNKPGNTVLVWIGSSSTRKYLEQALPFLEKASLIVPNLQLDVIADFELKSELLVIHSIAWSEASEAAALSKADIGIAPMPETDWTKGKCALKVLQYMAAGLPVISSKSGVNAYVVEDGVNGYLVNEDAQWGELIAKLSCNKHTLDAMGKAGIDRVKSEFDINAVFKKLLVVLESEST